MLWTASERSITDSVRNVMMIVREEGFRSVAFPIIGAGHGGFNEEQALSIMRDHAGLLSLRSGSPYCSIHTVLTDTNMIFAGALISRAGFGLLASWNACD